MIALLSCKKFSRRPLRAANVGDQGADAVIESLGPMECPICGPMSHVEMSWVGMLEVHGHFQDEAEALDARQKLIALAPAVFEA